MLTSKITEDLTLPHEPETVITIRKLSGPQVDRAREVRSEKQQADSTRALGRMAALGADVVSAIRLFSGAEPAEGEVADAMAEAKREAAPTISIEVDPLLIYDRDELLKAGIVAWSYPEPVTPENILDLDLETAEYVARAIAPKLRTDAEKKAVSVRSTRPSTEREALPLNG